MNFTKICPCLGFADVTKCLIYEVLKIRDFSKLLRQLFPTPQKLLRDPLWGSDPPVGNHCSNLMCTLRLTLKCLKCLWLTQTTIYKNL